MVSLGLARVGGSEGACAYDGWDVGNTMRRSCLAQGSCVVGAFGALVRGKRCMTDCMVLGEGDDVGEYACIGLFCHGGGNAICETASGVEKGGQLYRSLSCMDTATVVNLKMSRTIVPDC